MNINKDNFIDLNQIDIQSQIDSINDTIKNLQKELNETEKRITNIKFQIIIHEKFKNILIEELK